MLEADQRHLSWCILVKWVWPTMLWHAGVGLKDCRSQFITRPGIFQTCSHSKISCWNQAGDRGPNMAGSIRLQADTRIDQKSTRKDVHWECRVWCQWQKLASGKDAANELSLIVHLIVLDPVCMRQKASGSEARLSALFASHQNGICHRVAWLHS